MKCHIIGTRGADAYVIPLEYRRGLVEMKREHVLWASRLLAEGKKGLAQVVKSVGDTVHFDQESEDWRDEVALGREMQKMQDETMDEEEIEEVNNGSNERPVHSRC